MFFTIPNFLERMVEDPISVLTVLSITAIITTISLFFCGIPICIEIWRRKSTDEISGFPFLMGFLGGSFWLRYGVLKLDLTMITVNAVGVSLMFLYLLFYLHYTTPKAFFLFQLGTVFAIILAMLVLVEIYGLRVINPLGFVCMTFNIMNFGAPLAGLTVVVKKRSVETLPLPLCVANLLVSSQWCLYGVLVKDIYIIIPNGTGIVLAVFQVSLFLIFPKLPGGRAPLRPCFPCLEFGERHIKDEYQYQPIRVHPSRFSRRRMIHDRSMIPSSRDACIAFLRSNAFNSGGHGHHPSNPSFGGSISSRTTASILTADTTGTNSTLLPPANNTSRPTLSRVSSMSHPELWDAKYPYPGLVGTEMSDVPFDASFQSQSTVGGPSLLMASSVSASRPFEFDRIREVDELDRQWMERDLVRTLSAPDLAAE